MNCYFGVSNYYMYMDRFQMVVMRFSNCKKEMTIFIDICNEGKRSISK